MSAGEEGDMGMELKLTRVQYSEDELHAMAGKKGASGPSMNNWLTGRHCRILAVESYGDYLGIRGFCM
jgi:hypothetical protein